MIRIVKWTALVLLAALAGWAIAAVALVAARPSWASASWSFIGMQSLEDHPTDEESASNRR